MGELEFLRIRAEKADVYLLDKKEEREFDLQEKPKSVLELSIEEAKRQRQLTA